MGYITQEDLLRADGNLVWNMAINRETNGLDEDKIRQSVMPKRKLIRFCPVATSCRWG